MKIVLKDKIIKSIKGEVLKRDEKDLTLTDIILDALLVATDSDKNIESKEKVRRSTLAEMIYRSSEVDLETEDIALIKKLINNVFVSPWIVSAAYKMIENSDNGSKKNDKSVQGK